MIYIYVIIFLFFLLAYILLHIHAFFSLVFLPKEGKRIRYFLLKNKEKYNEAKEIISEYSIHPSLLAEVDKLNGIEKYAGIGLTVFIDFYNKNKMLLMNKYNYNFDNLDR